MIALDTNVLVRLVLQDDEGQARAAERVLTRARREQSTVYVADVVLCELVWVLTRRERFSRAVIADALDRLLRTELFVVSDRRALESAVSAYRGGRGDFADYVIREHAMAAGSEEVVTFDRVLRSETGFRVIGTAS